MVCFLPFSFLGGQPIDQLLELLSTIGYSPMFKVLGRVGDYYSQNKVPAQQGGAEVGP